MSRRLIQRAKRRFAWAWFSTFQFPISFQFSRGIKLKLYPDGEIPKLLYKFSFESREIELVTTHLCSGMNVIDVGANVGLYCLIANFLVGLNGHVWAFEPSSESFARLKRNLRVNKAVSVTPVQVALADRTARGALTRQAPSKDGDRYLELGAVELCDEISNQRGDREFVPVLTLDGWLQEAGLTETKLNFLKIDVEGGEFNVLRGAKETLLRNESLVVMYECTVEGCRRYGHRIFDVHNYLRGLGFCISCWEEEKKKWTNSEERLGVGANFWAARDARLLPGNDPLKESQT